MHQLTLTHTHTHQLTQTYTHDTQRTKTHLESSRPCAVPARPWPLNETWSEEDGAAERKSSDPKLAPLSCSLQKEAELVAMTPGAVEDSMVPEMSIGSGLSLGSCWLTSGSAIRAPSVLPLATTVLADMWLGEEWEDEEESSLVSTSFSSFLFITSLRLESTVPMSIMLDDMPSLSTEV